MLDKISKKIVEKLKKKDPEIKGDREEVVLFGITRIVEDIPKFIGTILICYFLGVLKELAIVFIINAIFKPFIGGAHARTNLTCFFATITYFLTIIYSSKIFVFNFYITTLIQILLFIFGMYIIAKYVPADTEEIPIINKEQRSKLQKTAYILFILFNGIAFVANLLNVNFVYTNYLIYTMFYINLMTIKPVYNIFGCKYGFLEYTKEGIL